MKFILASASPRRRELLASIGLEFEVKPSNVPEVREAGETPEEYVARLSRDKAAALAAQHPEQWV
ncbi:MAG TPA: Maf family protein, partial [Thermoanaerobaculia bacterium]